MMNLNGIWIKYDAHNCPLPSDAFIDGLAAGPNGRIWTTVHRQETVADDNRRTEIARMDGILRLDNDNWTWIPWGTTGLPQVMFQRRVVCDSAGELWLSSAKSVCRFDGQATKLFNGGENGLPNGPVFPCKLTPGRGNSMWLAMRLRGAYFFNGNDWQKFTIDDDEFPNASVHCIQVDDFGHAWFALGLKNEMCFAEYDGHHWKVHACVPLQKEDNVNTFVIAPDGTLWVGWDENGLWALDRPGGQWIKYTIENSALSRNSIQTLTIDQVGRVWVGAWDGITVFDEMESVCWWKLKPAIPDRPLSQSDIQEIRRNNEGPQANISVPTVFDQAVVDTRGRIWASSGNGISVFAEI